MKKQKLLRIVNVILFLDFLTVIISQILYQFHPVLNGEEGVLEVHEIGGFILVILVVIHFILNFSWIKNAYFKRKKK